jgi:hypothetical protein
VIGAGGVFINSKSMEKSLDEMNILNAEKEVSKFFIEFSIIRGLFTVSAAEGRNYHMKY